MRLELETIKGVLAPYVGGWGETNGAMIKNGKIVGVLMNWGWGLHFARQKAWFSRLMRRTDCVFRTLHELWLIPAVQLWEWHPSRAFVTTGVEGGVQESAGIQYSHTPNKAGFRWEHEVVLIDVDGSLTGNVFISDKIFWNYSFRLTQTWIVIAYSDESYLVPNFPNDLKM